MTNPTKIAITLKSAATFGRGDGVPGLVDREIEHDEHGFPFLRGKTLKGLLAESAENVVYALEELQKQTGWRDAKNALFGVGGRGIEERGILHIGDAKLPAKLRAEIIKVGWSKEDVLYSLTGIRRQTSINADGAPDHASLRAMRVLLRGVVLEAPISFDNDDELTETQQQLLAAAVLDFRRAGTDRNRGRGWLKAELDSEQVTQNLFTAFGEAIK
jgi:hypothetical protein